MSLRATLSFKNFRPNFETGLGKAIDRAVQRSVKVMERNVKYETPVREGHLRRSIRSRKTAPGEGEVYNEAVEGGKEIDYAIYVEYGTKYMAPRAMFRKGVAMSEKRIIDIFAEEARKVEDDSKKQ